ncbi:MAG: AraC family ligand binding domain-containing protein, partial [Candidatus Borkfalkiaceae bacterium]|nr:AraC family ligand binding domain-containing protein [Christensenellaceae bacterium]
MKYIEKTLNDTITVTGLVNLHFFEFSKDFYTEDEQHPFYELVYVATGKINIRSARYTGTLEKNELIIHYPNESHSLSCDNESVPTVIIIGFKCAG